MSYKFPASTGGGGGAEAFTDLTDAPPQITANAPLVGNAAGDAVEQPTWLAFLLEGGYPQVVLTSLEDGEGHDSGIDLTVRGSGGQARAAMFAQDGNSSAELWVMHEGGSKLQFDAYPNGVAEFSMEGIFKMSGFDVVATDTAARLTVDGATYAPVKAIKVKIGADTHYWPLFGGEDAGPAPSVVGAIFPDGMIANGAVVGNGAGDGLSMTNRITVVDGVVSLQAAANADSGAAVNLRGGACSGNSGGAVNITGGDSSLAAGYGGAVYISGGAIEVGQQGAISLSASAININSTPAIATQSVDVPGAGSLAFTHGLLTGFDNSSPTPLGGGSTTIAPVDYLDENFSDFSSGFVDTTVAPYNSAATENQSVICAYPNTPADAGIWVLGVMTDPEAVPVTRRADALAGTVFTQGQVIRVGSSTPPSTFARCQPYDSDYDNWQDSGVVGVNAIEFERGSNGGYYAIASGRRATASGAHSTASGDYSIASGNFSIASGDHSIASGANSIASGDYSTASGESSVASGYASTARVASSEAQAAGAFATPGDAQCGRYVLKVLSADNTPTKVLAIDEDLWLPNNASFAFNGQLIAREPATADSKCWKFEGLIKRGVGDATTSLVGAVTPVAGDSGATTWTVEVTADTTAGALAITVTGEADKTIQWVCVVNTVETIG
jgi:hypothetical protein